MTTSKEIASDIIAEGMLRKGKDIVGNVYAVSREVDSHIIEFMERQREIDHIKKEVSLQTGISIKELESKSRKQEIVRARRIAMKRYREAGFTLKKIGNIFNRNHSTVIHSIT